MVSANENILTQSKLKELLNYDKDTGVFTWISSRGNAKKGTVALGKGPFGYRRIHITSDGKRRAHPAHRIAWLYVYGKFPNDYIDHINKDRLDNRISNLREVDSYENMKNRKLGSNNTSGVVGVIFSKTSNKWKAQIQIRNKYINLGHFDDKNEAICARLHAQRLYKFHPNHGKKEVA